MGEEHQTLHPVLGEAEVGEEEGEPQELGVGRGRHQPASVTTWPAALSLEVDGRTQSLLPPHTPTSLGPALLLSTDGPLFLALCLPRHDAQLLLQLCTQMETQTDRQTT